MSHCQFTALSPLSLPWREMVRLRREARRRWSTVHFGELEATTTGHGTVSMEEVAFGSRSASVNFAFDNASLLRCDRAYWLPFDRFDQAMVTEFSSRYGVTATLTAHVVLSRMGHVCLVATLDLPQVGASLRFDQRAVRRLHEQLFASGAGRDTLESFVRERVLRPFLDSVTLQLGVRLDATHFVTTLVGGTEATWSPLLTLHRDEEGSVRSMIEEGGQSTEALAYLRFGWSYTTVVLRDYSREQLFVNLMLHLQTLWFAERSLREQLADFDYEGTGIRYDRAVAVEIEALNIERTFFANEVDDFRANLRPWLRDAYDLVHERWVIARTRDNVQQVVADLRAYFDRKLDVYESRQSKRQANVLFWIALLQFVAIYEGVGAYVSFLNLSQVDTDSLFRSTALGTAVIMSPVVLVLASIYAAYLYFRDDRQNGSRV